MLYFVLFVVSFHSTKTQEKKIISPNCTIAYLDNMYQVIKIHNETTSLSKCMSDYNRHHYISTFRSGFPQRLQKTFPTLMSIT